MKDTTQIIEDLKSLKESIDEAKSDKSKIEGKLEQLMDQFKKDFDAETIDEAERKRNNYTVKKNKLTKKLDEGYTKLKGEYTW